METDHEVGRANTTLDQGVLKCGPLANSITVTNKPIRHELLWAPPQACCMRSCSSSIGLAPFQGCLLHSGCENLWSGLNSSLGDSRSPAITRLSLPLPPWN